MNIKQKLTTLLILAAGAVTQLNAQTAVTVGAQVTAENQLVSGRAYVVYYVGNGSSGYMKDTGSAYTGMNDNNATTAAVYTFTTGSTSGTWNVKNFYTNKYWGTPTDNANTYIGSDTAGNWALNFLTGGNIAPSCNEHSWNRSGSNIHPWNTGTANVNQFRIYEVSADEINLTFDKPGSATDNITVHVKDGSGNVVPGVTASLVSTSCTEFKTGSAAALSRTENSVLAPNAGYANTQGSTITYTFKVEGLSTAFSYNSAALDVYALTGDGGSQYNNGNAVREWSFDVSTGSTEAGVTSFVSSTGNDICTVTESDGDLYHKAWELQGTSQNATAPIYIKVTLTKTDTNGCYAGIGAVKLYTFVNPFTTSDVYTINNTNSGCGAMMYNGSSSYVWSSGKSGTFSASDPNCQWVIIPTATEGQYYLYNVGADKFAIPSGTGSTASWIFSPDAVAVTLIAQSDGTKKIKTATSDTYAAVSNNYDGPIINYNDAGGNFTFTKVDGIDKSTEVTAVVNKLIINQTALTAAPTEAGWYAIRIKTDANYADQFLYTFATEAVHSSTNYPLGFYSAFLLRPSLADATYFVKLTKSTYGYYMQLPNGRYVQKTKPTSGIGESSITITYDATNHFTVKGDKYFNPMSASSQYIIGESSTSGVYYDIYPIDLTAAGLVAWQILCNDAPETTKIACTRSDVSGLTSVYKNGYIFLPTGVTPESTDFTLEGATSVTVDSDAKTVTLEYDPDLSIVAEGVSVSQGYQTAGRGNENTLLLRIDVTPIAGMTSAYLTVTLKDETKDNISSLYLYESDALEFIANIPNTALATTTDFSTGTATLGLGNVTAGMHHYWLCATVKSDADLGTILDAAVTGIGYTSTSDSPKAMSCDLTAVGDPSKQGAKVFALQNFVFKPTAENCRYYRIPSMMLDKNGNIVVAIDKRYNSDSDLGSHKIDVYSKRSEDGGVTWQDVALIAAGDGSSAAAYGYGDAGMVRTANGDLVCVMAAGSKRWGTDASNGMMYAGVAKSSDNGKTWTLTPNIFSTSNFYDEVHGTQGSLGFSNLFTTAGKGLTTNDGILMFATNGTEMGTTSPALLYILYSTDNGTTWRLSNSLAYSGCDESKLEQLSDGTLLVSVRQSGNRGWNKATYTKNSDGTVTFNWGTQYRTSDITGNACNADIINYGREMNMGDDVLIHSYINSNARESLQLAMSLDGGNSWKDIYNIQPNGSCYSTMQVLADGSLAILFEDESYRSGNGYAINYITIAKEQIDAWYEALYDDKYNPLVKNSVQGSATGANSYGSFTEASNNWAKVWTSNASSGAAGLAIASPGYALSHASVYNQRCLALRPSADGATDEITITAPVGYYIDSYTITGRNYSANQTYQLYVDENAKTTTSTSGATFSVDNVNAQSTSFKFYGSSASSNYLCITNFTIQLRSKYPVKLNTVGSASYATLYLPFDVKTDANTKAYVIKAVGTDYASLTELDNSEIAANTAVVLINETSDAAAFTVAGEVLTQQVNESNNLLKGTLVSKSLDLSDETRNYSLGKLNGNIGFYKFEGGTITLGANKAYLEVPASNGVKGFTFDFDDDATSIQNSKFKIQNEDAPIYNLAGQRLSKPVKGINIVGGKKVLK